MRGRWTNAHEIAADLFYGTSGTRADVRYVREELERRLRREGIVDTSEALGDQSANDPEYLEGLQEIAGNDDSLFKDDARVMIEGMTRIKWYPVSDQLRGWVQDPEFDLHLRATLDEVILTIQYNHRYLALIEADRRNALAYWEQKDMSEGMFWGMWREYTMETWFALREALGLSVHVPKA